jgi:3-methyladenine DNA glycosylase AlkC/predicted aspartyl protease
MSDDELPLGQAQDNRNEQIVDDQPVAGPSGLQPAAHPPPPPPPPPQSLAQILNDPKKGMKLSMFLSLNVPVTANVLNAFKAYAGQLTAKGKLGLRDTQWMADYVQNVGELYQRYLESKEETRKDSSEESEDDEVTPPLEQWKVEPREENRKENVDSKKGPLPLKLNELVEKPVVFDGNKPNPRKWLDDYEKASESNSWNEYHKVKYFATFLEKSAHDWLVTIARRKLGLEPEWRDLKAAFIRHYLGDSDKRTLRKQLETMKQGEHEKAINFIPRVMRLISLIDDKMPEEEIVDIIRDKLREEFKQKMTLSILYTVEQLNDACLRIEAELPKPKRDKNDKRQDQNKKSSNNKDGGKKTDKKDKNADKSSDGKSSDSKNRTNRKCYRCERHGHLAKDCRCSTKANGEPVNPPPKRNVQTIASEQSQSRTNQVIQKSEPNDKPAAKAGLNYITGLLVGGGSLIELPVKLNEETVNAIVDTGAFCSVISADVVRRTGWPVKRECPKLSHAAGQNLDCLGTVTVTITVTLGGKSASKDADLVVVDKLCTPFILGVELIRRLNLVIRAGDRVPVVFARGIRKRGARAKDRVTLPARSIHIIQAAVELQAEEVAVSRFGFDNRLQVANCVCTVKDNTVWVPIMNMDSVPICVQPGQQVASLQTLQGGVGKQGKSINQIIALDETSETIPVGDNLTKEQLQDLARLFKRHLDAFSLRGELGRTDIVQHEIELAPGAKPFKEPVRRHPAAHQREADRQVEEMLLKGIIEPSSSPWASEYVMVRKKTGDWRICVDFRRLNSVTKKNSFPLPNIEECIETLSGQAYFSKLDFISGYWQVPVAEGSRELTAFRTGNGLYQFRVMPFGLSNAPATFQKLINLMFSGLKGLNLQVFLDDVCVATSGWAEHIRVLDQVFTVIEKAGMKLRGSKCQFGTDQVIFLGHKISRFGVQQDPEKLRALQDLPAPTDVAGVRRVLGAFGYYRKFVYNFAAIASPISKLTRKDVEFSWGPEQQEAFERIKKELMKNATLVSLNDTDEIILKTDACKTGIAGILQQRQKGEWRIVACCSRGLSPAESNYSITELEGLALVYAVSKFRFYLLGRKFTILVDHCALCVLGKTKLPNNARLRRWALALSEFDFTVKYIKGTQHADADCLSRAPVADEHDNFLERILIVYPVDESEWVESYSDEDEELRQKAADGISGFYLRGRVPYWKGRLVVPAAKREAIIRESHDNLLASHDGEETTLARVAESFWWPNMRSQISSYVKTCKQCQLRKAARTKSAGLMQPHGAYETMAKVAFDYLGPLPASLSGNRFVIVAVDVFSKYLVATAVADQTASGFKLFFVTFCGNFGVPQAIVTDNGKAFINSEIRDITATFNIKHIVAAPRHSRGNAVAERAIESLQEKLSLILTTERNLEWDTALPIALLSLNTRRHHTTKFSPYEIMFNRQARPVQPSVMRDGGPSLFAETVRAEAIEASSNAHERAKERFDDGRPVVEYEIGEQVVCRASDRRPKLANNYEGPFEIVTRDKDIYELKNLSKPERRMRHVSQLKKYHPRVLVLLVMSFLTTFVESKLYLRETSPVVWVEERDRFVSEGVETSPYVLHFSSPCHIINAYANMLASQTAHSQNRVTAEVVRSGSVQGQQSQQLMLQQQQQQQQQQPARQQQYQQQPMRPQPQQSNQRVPSNFRTVLRQQPPIAQPAIQPGAASPVIPLVVSVPAAPAIPMQPSQPIALEDPLKEPEESEFELEREEHKKGHWYSKEEAERLGLNRHRRQALLTEQAAAITKRCETVADAITQLLTKFEYGAKSRDKRDLGSTLTNLIVFSAVKMVRSKWFSTHEDSELREKVDVTTRELQKKLNLMRLAQKVTSSNEKKLNNQVWQLTQNLEQYPSLQMTGEFILSELERYKSLLERLKTSILEDKLDTVTLAQLLNSTRINNVEIRDVSVSSVRPAGVNTVRMNFHGHVRSNSTKLYRIHAFTHYINLASIPVKRDYVGKSFLIKNSTSDCVKAVDVDATGTVDESCVEQGFRDPILKLWHNTEDANAREELKRSQAFMAWPNIIVYCWGNNLTVTISKKDQETPCPTYPFIMSSSQTFRTSDGMVSHTARTGKKELNVNIILDVQDVHFDEYEFSHQQIENNLQQIDKLQEEVGREVVYRHEKTTVTWRLIVLVVCYFILVILGIFAGMRFWFIISAWIRAMNGRKRVSRKEQTEELREVVAKQLNETITELFVQHSDNTKRIKPADRRGSVRSSSRSSHRREHIARGNRVADREPSEDSFEIEEVV